MSLEVQIRSKENNGHMLEVSFSCPEGICSLLGEAGSGKTRTLRSIAGLETPDEGRIVLNGTAFYDSLQGVNLPAQARRVGFLFRNSALFSHMTVKENIQAALLAGGLPLLRMSAARETTGAETRGSAAAASGRMAEEKNGSESNPSKTRHLSHDRQTLTAVTDQYLEEYHLSGLGGYYPEELSPLQQRRAALARMMAADPQLVLLDDPFTDLNPYQKASFLQETRDLLQKKGLPCVFAARDMEEAYAMGGSILVLHEGRSETMQKRADFFAHPQTITAALLAGVANVTDIRMLNPTHALAQEWGIILCADREPEAAADTSRQPENVREKVDLPTGVSRNAGEPQERVSGKSAGEDSSDGNTKNTESEKMEAAADHQNPGGEPSSPEEERRAKHREEMREDLERSLRFELINMPASAPAYPIVHWKKLPAGLAAIGIRAEDFRTEPPTEGPYLTFCLHDVKVEDTPRTWTISFRPKEDKPARITWSIPKTAMSRQQAASVARLYLPKDKVLWLQK